MTKLLTLVLLNIIAKYEKTEPGDIMNELHSIIGTEISSISPELEAHYAGYFSDRSVVVGLKQKYGQVFTDLENEQSQLVTELDTLATEVNGLQASYSTTIDSLNSKITQFNGEVQAGEYTAAEYASRKAELDAEITDAESERNAINALVDEYNTKKSQLDELNLQAVSLNASINSQVSAAPSL